jgi:hypothetical protein
VPPWSCRQLSLARSAAQAVEVVGAEGRVSMTRLVGRLPSEALPTVGAANGPAEDAR